MSPRKQEKGLTMQEHGYWDRVAKGRISRRRLIAAGGMGAAGLVVAAACGGGSSDGGSATKAPAGTESAGSKTPQNTGGTPKRGGRLKQTEQGAWGTIDPITSVGNATGLLPHLYNTLFNRSNANPDFMFLDLAESVEQVDPQTYAFKIRKGVKIGPNSLGVPERDMDAQDVIRYFDRIAADKDAVARVFTEPWLDSVTASPANDAITMKLKAPYAYFMSRLGRALGGTIPPREFFEKNISLTNQGVGAGPFVLKSVEESGNASIDRNPNYYRKSQSGDALPYVDGMDWVLITDRQAWRTAFLDKQVHSYGASTVDEANEIKGKGGNYVTRDPSFTFISFTMNPTKKPWDDDRVRKAALHALDRQQFIELIVGKGEGKADGLVHWPCGPYAYNEDELDQFQKYDPKMSHDLLKAATGNDHISVKITYPISTIEFHDQHLPIFMKQIKDAGFDVQEDPKDFSSWLGDYTSVKYDASLSLNQIYETSEIPVDWHSTKGPQGDGNFAIGIGRLYDDVEQAIHNSKTAPDKDAHIKAVRDVQKLIYDKGPGFLPIFSWYAYTNWQDSAKNIPQGLGDTGLFLSDFWLEG